MAYMYMCVSCHADMILAGRGKCIHLLCSEHGSYDGDNDVDESYQGDEPKRHLDILAHTAPVVEECTRTTFRAVTGRVKDANFPAFMVFEIVFQLHVHCAYARHQSVSLTIKQKKKVHDRCKGWDKKFNPSPHYYNTEFVALS